jgi:vacuolar-type H+-ATPase subunit H
MRNHESSEQEEVLRQLLEKEKSSREKVDRAKKEAEKTVEKAKEEAEKIAEEAEKSAQEEAESILKEAESKEVKGKERKGPLPAGTGNGNALKDKARVNKEEAVKLLTDESWDDLINAGSLEQAIDGTLADRIFIPVPFLHGNTKSFYTMLWRSHELENLFILLRGIHNRVKPGKIRSSLKQLGGPVPHIFRPVPRGNPRIHFKPGH